MPHDDEPVVGGGTASAPPESVDLTKYGPDAARRPTSGRTTLVASPPTGHPGGQLTVPAVPRGVPLSRQLVREICRLLDLDRVADVAELLASEVVTNAVLHASTRCVHIVVEVAQGDLTVSVADDDNRGPVLREAGPNSMSGRGLHLLDSLADEWGVTEWPDGKAVWFMISTGRSEAEITLGTSDVEQRGCSG